MRTPVTTPLSPERHLERRFPGIAAIHAHFRRSLPRFAFDYIEGGSGNELALPRNIHDLQRVLLSPRYLAEPFQANTRLALFGDDFSMPLAAAPLGLAGLLCPGSEMAIARATRSAGIGHVLSTFSNQSLENVAPVAGPLGWFQFYPPNQRAMEDDLLQRAHQAGYRTLVVTLDIPAPARRLRDIVNGLTVPARLDARKLMQALRQPGWCARFALHGTIDFGNLSPYYRRSGTLAAAGAFVDATMTGHISADHLRYLRDAWKGPLLVKGVLRADEALACRDLGVDGVIVSNHGGRQLDAAPSAVAVLPSIRRALGDEFPVLADGGVRSGLDIARMLACGADMVLVGRPFLYAASVLGAAGPTHLINLLQAELQATMSQLGCRTLSELRSTLERHRV